MRHTTLIFFSYLIKVSIFLFISNIAISQRVQLRNLERYLGKPIPERIGYVGVTDTMGDQRYMKLDSLVKIVADSVYAGGIVIEEFYISNDTIYVRITGDTKKNAKLPPGFTDTDDQVIDTVYFHDDSLYIKIEGDPRTWQVEINPMDNDVYVDSVYYKDNVDSLFLRVHKGSMSMTDTTLIVKIPDTDTQTLYRVSDSIGITRGNKISITDLIADNDNYVDALNFVLNTRTLTVGRTGALSDLSVVIPDRDSQYFSISGTNSITVDLVNGTGPGGLFTINTSGIITGSRSGSTYTLSATEVDGSTSNELQSPSWGSILSASANLVLSINNSTTAINTVGITLSGNSSALTFTASDQSATNEAQTLTNTGTSSVTSTLSQISGVGGGSITHQTTTGISLSHSSNIATWSVNDKDSTNEIQTIDTFIVKQTTKGDSVYLSLGKDNQAYKSVFINKHLDSTWFNNTTDTLYLRVRDTTLKVKIPDDGALVDNDNYVDTVYYGTNDTIIIGRTGSLPDLKIKITHPTFTDTDNYADALTFATSTRILTIGRTGALSDLTDTIPDSDNQIIDTFTIVGNALRLSLSGDGQPFKSVDLSPFLDNTDNQVIDTFTLVGNVIRLSISGDGQSYKSIDLSGFTPAGTNLTWVQGSNTMNSSTGTGTQINGFGSNVNILAGLGDKDSQLGTAGQIMVTTGSQIDWQNLVGGSGISISGTTITNTSTLGVGAGGATSSTLTTFASGQTPVTINASGIITISESPNTNGGSITLSAIESQQLSIVGQNLSISGGNTVTLPSYSDPDASPTNELQNLSWLSITSTKAIQGISSGLADTIHTSSTSGIIFSQQHQSLFIKAADTSNTNEGMIGVGAGNSTSSTIISNTTGQNAITVNAGGIITITETTNTNGGVITLNALEVDGDTTNELQYLRPYIVGTDTLGFISGITKDTVSFYGDTAGLGSGGGGGAPQVFSHAGTNYLLSTLSDGGGSIRINAGTQIQVTPSISGIDGIATIKTDFNGCPECVGFFGFNVGNTNDSIKTDPLFKYYYDEGIPTLEVPTVTLTQTNQYSNAVSLYIAANNDERVFTSGVDASGFSSNVFYHRITTATTVSLPSGHTGASTHYFINDGFAFTLSRSGSETIDGATSQSFGATDRLVIVSNDGSGKWYTNKSATASGNISYGIGPASPPQSISTTTLSDISNSTSPSIPIGRYMVRINIKNNSWGDAEGYKLALSTASGSVTLNIGKWEVHTCSGTTVTLIQESMSTATTINSNVSCSTINMIEGLCDITVNSTATIKVQLSVETSSRATNIWSGTVELVKIG